MSEKLNEYLSNAILSVIDTAKNDNPNGYVINASIGDFEISGVKYQLQVSLNPNKGAWCKKSEIQMSEITEIINEVNN